jgi:hypothetical protein
MKKTTILIILILIMGLMAATWSVAFAAGTQSVTAFVNPKVSIMINGAKYTPYDTTTGQVSEILIYKDRTYLPVRSIGEALNCKIGWDDNTKTVYVQNNL